MKISNDIQQYQKLKRRIIRKKRRQKFFRFILNKTIVLFVIKKIFKNAAKYLAIFYLAILLSYTAGDHKKVQQLVISQNHLRETQSILDKRNLALHQVTKRLEILETKKIELENQNKQLYERFFNVHEQLLKSQSERGDMIKDVETLEGETQIMKTTITDLQDNNSQLQQKMREFQKSLRSSKSANQDLRNVSYGYHQSLKQIQKKLHQERELLMVKLSELDRALEQKKSTLQKSQSNEENFKVKLEKVSKEKLQYQSEIALLQQKLELDRERFQEKNKDSTQKRVQLESEILLKNDELKQTKLKIQELEIKLEDQEKIFTRQLEEIRQQLELIKLKMENIDSQKRLEILLRFLGHIQQHVRRFGR